MKTRLLTKAEYLATFLTPGEDVTQTATNVLDIWPYVSAIPADDLWGHGVVHEAVESVHRRGDRFDHVLVETTTRNVFLVVIVDLRSDLIFGHFLLDLNEEYGLSAP